MIKLVGAEVLSVSVASGNAVELVSIMTKAEIMENKAQRNLKFMKAKDEVYASESVSVNEFADNVISFDPKSSSGHSRTNKTSDSFFEPCDDREPESEF